MDTLTRTSLCELAKADDPPYVSIYLPTRPGAPEARHDAAQLKSALQAAREELRQLATDDEQLRAILGPAHELVEDRAFWTQRGDGLEIFQSPRTARRYAAAVNGQALTVVGRMPHIAPLASTMHAVRRFHVMAISANQVRLLACDGEQVTPVESNLLPAGLEALEQYVQTERQLQYHVGATAAAIAGRDSLSFHGQGAAGDRSMHKVRLGEYCRMVDDAVCRILHGTASPLILACDTALAAIYRQTSRYPHLLEETIAGNAEHVHDRDLHHAAWTLMQQRGGALRDKAIHAYHRIANTARTADRLDTVLNAASTGRVDTLLLADGQHRWAPSATTLTSTPIHDTRQPLDEDLLNIAAVQTLSHGGDVLVAPANQLPSGGAAAILRY